MRMLTALSPFGRRSTPEYGLHQVQQKEEPLLSPAMPRSTRVLVRRIALCLTSGVLTDIPGLTPFWNSPTGFWVSSQTTATGNLQYSYPEFNGLDLSNPDAVQVAIANYINQQYGGGGSVSAASLFAQPAAGGARPSAAQSTSPFTAAVSAVESAAEDVVRPFHSRGAQPHTVHHGKEASGGAIRDWTSRVHFKKYELGGSFSVFLFLGDVPDDVSQWRASPSFVGAHVAFVNSVADKCSNCRKQPDLVDEGFVHLNAAIAKRSSIRSYEPDVIVPYLKKNLHWRILAVRILSLLLFG